ncbi:MULTISPECIES: sensor domain-containing diguanylate cyclase [Aeromonas]|uniref:sensor domain-containing diguanylate cyclase n=1 Tax=Aeromonas TaxID=642 RepID=UPI001D0B57AB|nr:diguanylate cyclase [Aeromonas veronii]UDN22883.1 diguanylate cyclase [Aeromonas veronii]
MLSKEARGQPGYDREAPCATELAAMPEPSSGGDAFARLQAEIAALQHENGLLQEKLNAALDGTGICLWQGTIPTGELRVFNLQNFQAGDMAPHFDQWSAKLHPDDRAHAMGSYFAHLERKTPFYEAEYRTISPAGEITWLWDRGRVVEWDDEGRPLRIMGSHIDITQRKAYEQRLAERANCDALTGLLNRQGFGKAFALQPPQGTGALLFIDLDDFKGINDQLGHACGDQVLQQMAEWLRLIMPGSALCGRYGGDEFVVYLHRDVSNHALAHLADALICRMHGYVPKPGCPQRVGLSIGIALWEEQPLSFRQALEVADRAMYEAKARGKRAWYLLQV